jgi:hypothetical protein
MAFLVANTTWVLCFGYNLTARRDAVLRDFRDEVDTLVRIGGQGVRVPKPFPASPPSPNFIFEMNCYNDESGRDGDVYAFLLEFMSSEHFVEMPKGPNEKKNFAKINIVPDNRLPPTIAQTRADLVKICAAWKIQKWGDFQVMYNKTLGTLTVFDPQATDGRSEQHQAAMNQWLADIDAAIELDASKIAAARLLQPREPQPYRGLGVGQKENVSV